MTREEKRTILAAIWIILGIMILWTTLKPVGAQENCRRHDCSDDTVGVYGNEWITHDPASEWNTRSTAITPETQRCYEYAAWDIPLDAYTHLTKKCDSWLWNDDLQGHVYQPPRPGFNPYGVEGFHPPLAITFYFAMRSCIGLDTPEQRCGSWQPFVNDDPLYGPDYIELVGGLYACFNSNPTQGFCEYRCTPGAVLQFYGNIRECE